MPLLVTRMHGFFRNMPDSHVPNGARHLGIILAIGAITLAASSSAAQGDVPTPLRVVAIVTVLDSRLDTHQDSLRLAICALTPVLGPNVRQLIPARYHHLLLPVPGEQCERAARAASPLPVVTTWRLSMRTDSSTTARLASRDTVLHVEVHSVVGRFSLVESYRVERPMLDGRYAWTVGRYERVSESLAH